MYFDLECGAVEGDAWTLDETAQSTLSSEFTRCTYAKSARFHQPKAVSYLQGQFNVVSCMVSTLLG